MTYVLVKICYKLYCTYVIQGVKKSFDKVTSWPQLISKFLVAPTYTLFATLLLIDLAPFYALGVFV